VTLANGGTITLDLPITIQRLTLTSGTITGPNDLTANELFTWSGGTLGGTGALNANGGVDYSGGLLDGRRLNNAGTFNANNVLVGREQRGHREQRHLQHQPRGEHRHVRQFDRREQLHQLRHPEQDEQQRSCKLRAAADESRHGARCGWHV
jgi:hypothetical protein